MILRSIWGPKSVQNEVGTRIGKVIGKRRAKDRLIGANLGSKMGSCWAENRRRMEAKKSMEKRNVKKRVMGFGPRKFPGSGARRKPLAKAKGSSEERRNGGLEVQWRTAAAYLSRHRPEAWRILQTECIKNCRFRLRLLFPSILW